jgi:hypothetical protein
MRLDSVRRFICMRRRLAGAWSTMRSGGIA